MGHRNKAGTRPCNVTASTVSEPRILARRDGSLCFLRPDVILKAEGRAEQREVHRRGWPHPGWCRLGLHGNPPLGSTEPVCSQAGLPLPWATPPALGMGASGRCRIWLQTNACKSWPSVSFTAKRTELGQTASVGPMNSVPYRGVSMHRSQDTRSPYKQKKNQGFQCARMRVGIFLERKSRASIIFQGVPWFKGFRTANSNVPQEVS